MLSSPKIKKITKVKPTNFIKKGKNRFKSLKRLKRLKSTLTTPLIKSKKALIVKKQRAAVTRVKPTVKKESTANPVKTKKTNPSRNGSPVAKR